MRTSGVRLETVCRTAQGTAVAQGGEVTLWTPATGKCFRLRQLLARASVAGRYELRDGGSVAAYLYLKADEWGPVLDLTGEVYGCLSEATGNTLKLRNNTGGPVDVDVVVIGSEE